MLQLDDQFPFITMLQLGGQGAHDQERLMANQSDLTLQGTNTASNCPVGLYEPTIPLPASNYRFAPPAYSQPSPTRDHQK